MIWWIAGGLLAVVLVYIAVIYNRLVGLNKRVDGGCSGGSVGGGFGGGGGGGW